MIGAKTDSWTGGSALGDLSSLIPISPHKRQYGIFPRDMSVGVYCQDRRAVDGAALNGSRLSVNVAADGTSAKARQ
jgi:hypothetical protein